MAAGSDTPIFIPTRDRVSGLRALVSWLEAAGHTRIVIVDGASTYEPMTEYLAHSPHEVIRLPDDPGPLSPWLCGAVGDVAAGHRYVVAHPDAVPTEECPHDAVEFLTDALQRYPLYVKAGLGLRLDDLPSTYQHAALVRAFEAQFWWRRIRRNLYQAPLGCTFAVYQPGRVWPTSRPAIRTGAPYLARNLRWYVDSAHPTHEERFCRMRGVGDTPWSADDEVGEYLVVPPAPGLIERARWRTWVMLRNREQ